MKSRMCHVQRGFKQTVVTSLSLPKKVALPPPVSSSSFPPLSPIPIPFLPVLPFLSFSLPFGFGDFSELIPSTETRSIWAPTFRLTFFRFFWGTGTKLCARFGVVRVFLFHVAGRRLPVQGFRSLRLAGLRVGFRGFRVLPAEKTKKKRNSTNYRCKTTSTFSGEEWVQIQKSVALTSPLSLSFSLFLSPFSFLLSLTLSLTLHTSTQQAPKPRMEVTSQTGPDLIYLAPKRSSVLRLADLCVMFDKCDLTTFLNFSVEEKKFLFLVLFSGPKSGQSQTCPKRSGLVWARTAIVRGGRTRCTCSAEKCGDNCGSNTVRPSWIDFGSYRHLVCNKVSLCSHVVARVNKQIF